ncbi:hypothetical protein QCA22_004773 [Salmonella enterica]|nr:hypothetical protein [Salmonella enterica]EKS5829914.1 hypothetical protein [Salmonella enterica]EKS5881065.1 hypothetical protein [Salmonella enterica]
MVAVPIRCAEVVTPADPCLPDRGRFLLNSGDDFLITEGNGLQLPANGSELLPECDNFLLGFISLPGNRCDLLSLS